MGLIFSGMDYWFPVFFLANFGWKKNDYSFFKFRHFFPKFFIFSESLSICFVKCGRTNAFSSVFCIMFQLFHSKNRIVLWHLTKTLDVFLCLFSCFYHFFWLFFYDIVILFYLGWSNDHGIGCIFPLFTLFIFCTFFYHFIHRLFLFIFYH